MKGKIANRFLINYLLMFIISILITIVVLILTDFANDVISKNLIKNQYTANDLMRDDYKAIPYQEVVSNGGGVQVINSKLEVVLSQGIDTINKQNLTMVEWSDFLTNSKRLGIPYSYTISYNEKEKFWLIITFPTSVRIDVAIAHNELYKSKDTQAVYGVIIAVILFYLLLLAIVTLIYSRLTSISLVNPLKKLYLGARQLGEGNYATRVEINANNEIGELGHIFNHMAEKIEKEIDLREKSEVSRKQLILDISHDLKNPLSSILGYTEQLKNNMELSEEKCREYLKVIYDNGIRLNGLINDLFELSRLESGEYKIVLEKTDICEYVRMELAVLLPMLEASEFAYEFFIPEDEIYVLADRKQLSRVLHNLIQNAVQYNPKGTNITIEITRKDGVVDVKIIDNGIGISKEVATHIFEPFVRVEPSRNPETGGAGLGLSIAEKIMNAHGGSIELITDVEQGCEFILHFSELAKN